MLILWATIILSIAVGYLGVDILGDWILERKSHEKTASTRSNLRR